MTKHVPSSHELESAVIGVLEESKTEMTAKSVRTILLAQKPGWKMPAERRIAKFVKRQNSKAEKKLQDGSTKSVFGKFFKSDHTSNHSINTTNTSIKNMGNASASSTSSGNHSNQQQQQQQVSQRKGFRQASVSMLKALSKSKKSNQDIPVTTSSTANLFKKSKVATDAAGPISYQQAEADRSASVHPEEAADDAYPQAKAVIENVHDMEHIKAADEKRLSLKKEAPATKETGSSDVPGGKDVEMAYVDDNDGQLNHCRCEACVIM